MNLRRSFAAAVAATAALVTMSPAMAHAASPSEYVALGDSYSSGTGTFSRVNDCYQSTKSYPSLLAQRYGWTLKYEACSGATISSMLTNQMDSLTRKTKYVTVTIGGNDLGFASLARTCATSSEETCTAAVEVQRTKMQTTFPAELRNAYKQIKAKAPNAKIVVAGYPRLFSSASCVEAAGFTAGERTLLNNFSNEMGYAISREAVGSGLIYTSVNPSFIGHEVCTPTPYVNGYAVPVSESFHPNRAGNVAYADRVGATLVSANA